MINLRNVDTYTPCYFYLNTAAIHNESHYYYVVAFTKCTQHRCLNILGYYIKGLDTYVVCYSMSY